MTKLQARNLSVRIGPRTVLDDVSVAFGTGEILGLVGPNGAGKSTLIKALLGQARLMTGAVICGERDLTRASATERARLTSYVPQTPPDGFPVSVFQAVLMGRTPHMGMHPSPRDLEVTEWAINQLQLAPLAFRMLDALSGGERQRVMLARALAQETPLIVLDEPTSALDIAHQLFALQFLSARALQGKIGVLIALHDLSMAARFASRLVLLHKGRVVADGDWRSTLTPARIRETYGVNALIDDVDGVPVILATGTTG